MLVITRKLNGKLQIGDINVHVVKIHKGNIFLNITLPNGEVKCEVVNENEEIQVAEDVVIKATLNKGKHQVRIGISAPKSMAIKRI